uniref:HSP 70h n=1 Tax=Rose leaf rosette-associated virus TaxID=1543207 RepID=A0A7U1BMQ0_9CLOS|nr:HSP 70h [Rose leaf rosette-associated virus]
MVVFGLDFGTTFSTLALATEVEYILLKQSDSAYIPTALFLPSSNVTDAYYGYDAEYANRSGIPGWFFKDLKRWVGCTEKSVSEYIDKLSPSYSVKTTNLGNSAASTVMLTPYGQREPPYFNLPDLIALYIKCICADGERAFGVKCTGCVCSVPAGYNTLQRAFTEACVLLSSYVCVYILNEPSAAALASAPHLEPSDKRLMVYDFGGGTFDVSAVTVAKSTFVVKASGGDMTLGGRDVDRALSDALKKRVGSDYPGEIDVTALKEALSTQHQAVKFEIPKGVGYASTLVDMDLLRELSAPFINRTIDILEKTRTKAGFLKSDEVKLVVVGGSSTLPGLKEALTKVQGVVGVVNLADHRAAVACGCALYARGISTDNSVLMVDCATSNISISSYRGDSIVVIPAGSPIPFDGEREIEMLNATATSTYNARLFEGNFMKCAYNELIYSKTIELRSLGVVAQQPTSAKLKLLTKIDSVGKISFSIVGPSGVPHFVQGKPHYDLSGLKGPQRNVVKLNAKLKKETRLLLAATINGVCRQTYPLFKLQLEEVLKSEVVDNDTTLLRVVPYITSEYLNVADSRMGELVSGRLRGTDVESIPF